MPTSFHPVPEGPNLLGLIVGRRSVRSEVPVSGMSVVARGARLPKLTRKPLEPVELLRGVRLLTLAGLIPLERPPDLPLRIGMVLSFH